MISNRPVCWLYRASPKGVIFQNSNCNMQVYATYDFLVLLDRNNANAMTPLFCAIARTNLKCIKVLVQNDLAVDQAEDCAGFTPLTKISKTNNEQSVFNDMFEYLVKNRAAVNRSDQNQCTPLWALMHCACVGSVLFIEKIMLQGARPDKIDTKGKYVWNYAMDF